MSKTNKQHYDEYDETIWEKILFDNLSNGYVVIHKQHGKHEREGNLGYRVELLAVFAAVLSPDATINAITWEFKTTSGSYSSIQNRLRDGKEQCENILLALPTEFIIGDTLRGILSAINVDRDRKIQTVGLLFDYEIIFLNRSEIKQKDYSKLSHYFDKSL
jgi:Contact-dependent growth inhibition CdiA C-terminal domain